MAPLVVGVGVGPFLDRLEPGDPEAMRSSVLLHLLVAAGVTACNLCGAPKGLRLRLRLRLGLLRGSRIKKDGDTSCSVLKEQLSYGVHEVSAADAVYTTWVRPIPEM